MNIPLFDIATMVLASGRIAYAVTVDEVFRPMREAVFRHSAPLHATDIDGYPWRMIDSYKSTQEERERWPEIGKWMHDYREAGLAPRKPGFWGELLACFYCFSAWTSFAIFAAYIVFGSNLIPFLAPFALWALSNGFAKWLHS